MTEELIAAEDLSVAAGGKKIIENFSFSASAGEIIGFTGPSGCGKTTLFRALAGLDGFICGSIKARGIEISDWHMPSYRRSVLYVSQRPSLHDSSARENLNRPFGYASAKTAFPEEQAKKLLAEMAIEPERLEQNARSLSEGQQQRLCIARALLINPDVMLLDEPTASLDPESVGLVENILKRQASEGMTILMVTHNHDQANNWADRRIDLTSNVGGK